MKKRFLTVIFTLFAMITCIFGLSACNKVEFKVNFVVDGEVYSTINTNGEEVIKIPENPTKEGYIFDGWYWDKDTWQTPFTANSLLDAPISSDMNVYCKWKVKNVGVESMQDNITFNTLKVNGEIVYGKVSNDTATFSFIQEITEHGNATYKLYKEITCENEINSETISLEIGDNTVYVLQSIGKDIKLYTVTVRRRPTYSVTFNVNGGSAVENQVVEEDSLVVEPTTIKAGYTFNGWDYDFSKPIVEDAQVTATWSANEDTKYVVEYYHENIDNSGYTKIETVNKTGTTDTTAKADIKDYEHFTYNEGYSKNVLSGNINGNGSTVLKVYYTRNSYTVTFDGNGGTLSNGKSSQTVKYGGSVTAPTFAKTGYTHSGFDKSLTNVSESFTATAFWQINQYTVTIKYGNGLEDKVITQDYNTPIEDIENPERSGYTFNGWDKVIPTIMPAYNTTINAKWLAKFNLSNGEITGLTSHGKTLREIVIPENIDGVKITSIGDWAFSGCTSLTSIEIPNNVTSIGEGAFANCYSLTKVIYLGTIDEWVQIDFVNSISNPLSYSANLYINNELVTEANITTATKINAYAFFHCYSLTSVVISNSVTSIGEQAFAHCHKLTSVTIGDSVTSIGEDAFYDCESLTSVTIGNSVESIGEDAFGGCNKLVEVINKSSNITVVKGSTDNGKVGYCALSVSNCDDSYVSKVSTDSNGYVIYTDGEDKILVNYVGEQTELILPSDITKINKYAFDNSDNITSVTIDNSVTSIGDRAFFFCDSLTSVTIGDSVTSIGEDAFYDCESLTSVTIGDSVTSIGEDAFISCDSLINILVNENNENYKSVDGNLYSKDGTVLIKYAVGKTDASFTIPSGVTSIGEDAFYDCESLTSITIPSSVTSIGYSAFNGCTSLTSIIIPDSVTSIGDSAFYNCESLTSVTIGNGVTSIGYSAFSGCDSLTSITIPNSVTSIGEGAFDYCESLTSVTIGNGVTSIGYRAFYYCESLTSITFSDTSTWYRTDNYKNWNNKTGGTQTDVTSPTTNDDYFKSSYCGCYWYKL